MNNLRKHLAVGLGCAIAGLSSQPALLTILQRGRRGAAQADGADAGADAATAEATGRTAGQADADGREAGGSCREAGELRATAPVTAAEVPSYETKSEIKQPPSALPGVNEPLPEGYVRLGDTGNLLKIDLVAQLDAMTDDTKMTPDLFVTSAIPVKGSPFYNAGWRSNLSGKQSIFRLDFRRDTPLGVLKVVYKNNFFGSSGDMGFNTQYFYSELENDRYDAARRLLPVRLHRHRRVPEHARLRGSELVHLQVHPADPLLAGALQDRARAG